MAKSSRRALAAQSQVSKSETVYQDIYVGEASALIAEGWVTADQLPGLPGRSKTMASFLADGSPSRAGKRIGRMEGYKQVFSRPRGLYKVMIWVSLDEASRRAGIEGREWMARDNRFPVGDACLNVARGEPVRIVAPYGVKEVWYGDEVVVRSGYIYESARGRFFAPAALLWDMSGRPPYLRLVSSAGQGRARGVRRAPDLRLVSSTDVQRAPVVL